MIPNKGWLPAPLNHEIQQFTLPEVYSIYYYVCNPGPYDPAQPYQPPIVTYITINQLVFGAAGYKNGTWGWVAGINWTFAYGDALIESIYPPLDPAPFDEACPGEDFNTDEVCPVTVTSDEVCPPDTPLSNDTRTAVTVTTDSKASVSTTTDTIAPTSTVDEDCPGSRSGNGCE